MKILITIIALAILLSCSTNSEPKRKVYISEAGWTFHLNHDTKLSDSAFDETGKITWQFSQVGTTKSIDLFSIRNDSTNFFKASVLKDSVYLVNWDRFHRNDNRFYFKQISMSPDIQLLDTSYTTEVIDGISFIKEHVKSYSKRRNITASDYNYFGKFKGFELAISFTFF